MKTRLNATARVTIETLQRNPDQARSLEELGLQVSDSTVKANLKSLADEGLVEVVTPKHRVARLYYRLHPADSQLVPLIDVYRWRLTDLGRAV